LAVVTLVGDTLLIPVEIRRLLHLSPRDAVRMEPVGNTLVLRPVSRHAGGTLCRGRKSRVVPLVAHRGASRPIGGRQTPHERCQSAMVADVAGALRR
jgi:bifunctional DNA-binding transcriptional regulator/antitoxin component of YhaV-PrlF toxin-antitoxin module